MRLGLFITASFALNLGLWSAFGAFLDRSPSSTRKDTVQMRLVHSAPEPKRPPPKLLPVTPPASQKTVACPEPKRIRRTVRRRRPEPQPAPTPVKTAAATTEPASPVPAAPSSPDGAQPAPRPRPVAAPVPVRPAPRIRPTPPAPPRPTAGQLAALRSRIRKAIYRHRHYPRQAQRRGIEGTVVLTFRLTKSGHLAQVRVVRSAGRILDRAARVALRRAAPLPYYPDWVRIPIVYRLED